MNRRFLAVEHRGELILALLGGICTSLTSLKQLEEHIDAYVNAYNDKAEPLRLDQEKGPSTPFKRRRITQF